MQFEDSRARGFLPMSFLISADMATGYLQSVEDTFVSEFL